MADVWVPPSEFDEYRLLRELGRGGMGSVWLAQDTLLDRLVAVKWIAHAEPSDRTRARFAVEARAAARLQHENVVTVHRYGEAGGRPYLVSEYIRGESLDRLEKPIVWQRAAELGTSLACGLAAAHRHGIVHRDLKPANAILAEGGEVKLVDFGLARLDADGDVPQALSPRVSGTPAYLAPEVRRGDPATRRSDVYQIGCILYELVTGRPPLFDALRDQAATADGDQRSLTDAERNQGYRVPSLRDRLSEDGAAFAAVVDRCLAVDPEQRFASGDEVREALEALGEAASPVARIEGNPYRGLMPFESEHRALFFGRTAEARTVCERIRADAFVLVAGDSGVGKSSLCRAAVLPWIGDGGIDKKPWTIVRLVPGAMPMTALVSALASALQLDEDLLNGLRDQPAAFVRALRRAAPDGLVVFVDQLEELVSLSDRGEAAAAALVLDQLLRGGPRMRLLATVRGDFLTRVAALPALGDEIERAICLLGPLTATGAREAVVGPARATGVSFESDALVDEMVAFVADPERARVVAALPLLAFTLAQLWEERDKATSTISAATLAAIGGVRGALAAHADRVLEQLLPEQRRAARRILVQLVAPESTRARRSERELTGDDRAYVAALDALVRGRLAVARGSGEETTYELAHEGLIDGWPTLAELVSETAHLRAVHGLLTTAAADWNRRSRGPDGLWGASQLADVAPIPVEDLTAAEAAFVTASRRAVARRRWIRGVLVALAPISAIAVYAGAELVARRDLDTRVEHKLRDAERLLVDARAIAAEHGRLRTQAFALFDAGELPRAEAEWATVRERGVEASEAYARAAGALEAAFLLDTDRSSVRRSLAELTLERLELAERNYKPSERDELATRLALYDPSGSIANRRSAPGELELAVEPASATLAIVSGPQTSGPLARASRLAPGTYVLEATAPGRSTVRWPVRVRPGERQRVAFTLPRREQLPPGFVFAPPGRFAYGSRDDEVLRAWFGTVPMHDVETGPFLIATHEVTYQDWIEFLADLSPEEREMRTPRMARSPTAGLEGTLELTRHVDGSYELLISPAGVEYRARSGEPIVYSERTIRAAQDWRRFPVTGINAEDAAAFAVWLARTGRVAGARLCTEREWEHAARGVDGRTYPHGERVAADDANIDITYGKKRGGYGFDEVGAHPRSNSIFGAADMVGNAWELVRAANGDAIITRGGSYYVGARTAHLANRQEVPSTLRNLHIGVRLCADAPNPIP